MCFCSCSCSSSLWRCYVPCAGPILVLLCREQPRCALRSHVCSSLALHTIVPPVVSPPLPHQLEGQCLQMSRPWREVKSRRGAPKRIPTEGFACPNRQCRYFGNTDAHFHALVGDGKHGHAEQIQTFRCQACRTTFSARRDTPMYRLKTPSHQVAMVRISRWLKGWILLRPRGSSTFDKPRLPGGSHALASTHTPCTSASSAICGSRTCNWTNCEPGCAAIGRYSGSGWPLIL